jgi:hypothetical protein
MAERHEAIRPRMPQLVFKTTIGNGPSHAATSVPDDLLDDAYIGDAPFTEEQTDIIARLIAAFREEMMTAFNEQIAELRGQVSTLTTMLGAANGAKAIGNAREKRARAK